MDNGKLFHRIIFYFGCDHIIRQAWVICTFVTSFNINREILTNELIEKRT